MGQKAIEPLELTIEDLPGYLRTNHSVYMEYAGKTYYLTDVNDSYWRVQDTATLNEKGHYSDCSDLVETTDAFLALPAFDGKTVGEAAAEAVFYASQK